jgi:peptidase E
MLQLYFIGGEDIRKPESIRAHDALLHSHPECSVLIFPWTAPPTEKSRIWHDIYLRYFLSSGVTDVQFADLNSPRTRIIDQIERSDILYLPGWDQRLLLAHIHAKKLSSIMHTFTGVIVGNSAGAIVMSRLAILRRGQEGEPDTSFVEGLSLAPITLCVHYGTADRLLAGNTGDVEIAVLSRKIDTEIYAIPETSAVIVIGDKVSFFGDVFIFRNGQRLIIEP